MSMTKGEPGLAVASVFHHPAFVQPLCVSCRCPLESVIDGLMQKTASSPVMENGNSHKACSFRCHAL